MPSESGVTSSSSTSFCSPVSTAPWIAAPIATTSSGLTPLFGSLPKNSFTISWIFGMRVEPPTRMHLVDVLRLEARVLERLLHRRDRALDEVVHELLELRARERVVEVLRARLVGGDERQVDVRRLRRRQLHLRLLGGFLEALERHRILREVDRLVALELGDEPVDDALVEVVAAEVRVAVGRLHLELARALDVVQLEHRDVVGAAAEVEDGDLLVLLLVEAVGERRRRRLVDDAQHVEAGDLAGVLRRLALRVVEVRGHGDDRLARPCGRGSPRRSASSSAGSSPRSRAACSACPGPRPSPGRWRRTRPCTERA